jgi:hypothetical protein
MQGGEVTIRRICRSPRFPTIAFVLECHDAYKLMNLHPIYAPVIASLIVPAVALALMADRALAAEPQMPKSLQGTWCPNEGSSYHPGEKNRLFHEASRELYRIWMGPAVSGILRKRGSASTG